MDVNFVSSLVPPAQELLGFPRFILPYEYHQQVVGSIQPVNSFVAQAKGTKKSKLSAEESGQPRNRWRAHKKETCRCAVCKQVRGELSSTWFKHDKANCKCSVCRQARGEKRIHNKIASCEPKKKRSLISNRIRRLAGKMDGWTPQSSPVLQNIPEVSGLSGISKSTNLLSEKYLTGWSNLPQVAPNKQSYVGGAGVPSVSASDLLEQNMTERLGTSTVDTVAGPVLSLGPRHLTLDESPVALPYSTSCVPKSQINSDKIIFSWKYNSSCAVSESESLHQAPSQALDAPTFTNSADLTVPSKRAHTTSSYSAFDSSVIPSSMSDMDGGIFSSEARHLTLEESSELPYSTSCLPGSRLNSEKMMFSWRYKSPFPTSESKNRHQLPSQAVHVPSVCNSADMTAPSETAHISSSVSALDSSVVPTSMSDIDGTLLFLSCTASTSESKSGFTRELSRDIMDVSRRKRSGNFVVLSEGTRSSSEEPNKTTTVSDSHTDMEATRLRWSGEPLIAESYKAPCCQVDTQTSDCTIARKSVDRALPLVTKIPHITLRGPSTVNLRKRKGTCTHDRNVCKCDGCRKCTISELLCRPMITYSQGISSTLKRRRIFSLAMDRRMSLQGTLEHDFGFVSSEHLGACESDKLNTKISFQSLLLGQHGTDGSPRSPGTTCEQSSYSSGIGSSITTSSVKSGSYYLQTASRTRCRKMPLTSSHASRVWVPSSLMFFLQQAGQESRITLKGVSGDVHRSVLRIMGKESEILPENLKVRGWEACVGHSGFDTYDHRRDPHQAQSRIVDMPSQKSADVRTHRSQSALLLGEQPCSLLRVAHVNLPRNYNSYTFIRKVGFGPHGVFQNVRSFETVADILNSFQVCSVLLSLRDPLGGIRARAFHEELFQIDFHVTGKIIFFAVGKVPALPYTQTVPRRLLKLTCSLRANGSCNFLSARRRESVCSSSPKVTEGNMECVLATGVMSSGAVRPRRVEDFIPLAQHCVVMQQRRRDKRKHGDIGFDGTVHPLPKRKKFSCSGIELSAFFPAIRRWTPVILGSCSASPVLGSRKRGVLQFSISKSPGELVGSRKRGVLQLSISKSPGELGGSRKRGVLQLSISKSPGELDGSRKRGVLQLSISKSPGELGGSRKRRVLQLSVSKSPGDLVGSRKHRVLQLSVPKLLGEPVGRSNISAVTQCTDSPCQRAKPLASDRVEQTTQIQQSRQEGENGTSRQDRRSSLLSSGLSFQELLRSVSQTRALSSMSTSSSIECVSVPASSSTEGKSGGCTPQDMWSALDIPPCNYGKDSRMQDPSYTQRQGMTVNEEVPWVEDEHENNHEDEDLTGDISNSPDVSSMASDSLNSEGMEDTLAGYSLGCPDENSSAGEQYATHVVLDLEETDLVESVSSSVGVQEPALQVETLSAENTVVSFLAPATPPPLSRSCRQDKFAARDKDCPRLEELVTTTFSMSKQLDLDEVEVLQTNMVVEQEKTEFRQKLKAILEKPFDMLELEELEKSACVRKPQMRLRESRHQTRHVPIMKEGFSYLEHYPEFRRKLESTKLSEDKLNQLRGFFFWIQHTCMSGAFMPWEEKADDDDCVQIVKEKCGTIKRSRAGSSVHTKELKGRGGLGAATTYSREIIPGNNMHMILRSRKKIVYTDKLLRVKRTGKQRASIKVKTEGNAILLQEMSYASQ